MIFNSSSGTISATDVFVLGRSLNWTGWPGSSGAWRTSSSTNYMVFGSVTIDPATNFGINPNTFYIGHWGRDSHTITSNGVNYFQATAGQRCEFYGVGATYTIADPIAVACSAAGTALFNVVAGTVNLGTGLTHSIQALSSAVATYVRQIIVGPGTVISSTTASTSSPINFSTTNLTADLRNLHLIIAAQSANTRTITSGSAAPIGTVTYTVADSPGSLSLNAGSGTTIETLNIGPGRSVLGSVAGTIRIKNWNGTGQNFGGQKMFGQSAGNLLSTPHSAALNIGSSAADITIDVKVTLADWTPGSRFALVCKINSGLTAGYLVRMETSGAIGFFAAGGQITSTVSAATVFNDGDTGWIRVQRRTSDGRCQFFTSPDGSTWTQLGTDVTLASGTNIGSNTEVLYLGSRTTGNDPMGAGQMFHRCRIYSDLTATTRVASPDFEAKPVGDDTLTDAEGNVWTIGAAIVNGDGRLGIKSLTNGSPCYLELCGPRLNTDYMKVQDIWDSFQKLYVGSNSLLVSGNTGVNTGTAPTGQPYIVQQADATGSSIPAFAFSPTPGNTLVALVTLSGTSPSWVTPTGYTLIRSTPGTTWAGLQTYIKTSDGSETTFVHSSGAGTPTQSYHEIAGLGTPTTTYGENASGLTTSLQAATSAPSLAGSSGIALAFWTTNSTQGAAVSGPDSGFQELRSASKMTQLSKGFKVLTASGAANSTYGWTTSRVAASQVLVLEAGVAPTNNVGIINDVLWA